MTAALPVGLSAAWSCLFELGNLVLPLPAPLPETRNPKPENGVELPLRVGPAATYAFLQTLETSVEL